MVSKKKNPLFVRGLDRKIRPRDHWSSFLGKTLDANQLSSGQIFLSHPHIHEGFLKSTIRGLLYSKFSFGEVYCRIYGWKFSVTARREGRHKTLISEHISNDIPPQMKNLNMIIPILMHY